MMQIGQKMGAAEFLRYQDIFGFGSLTGIDLPLTGISPSLYEAAAIDGASRWKRVWHITIPGLVPTIVLLTTLAMGNVLNAGFDQVFNMYNQLVIETGDIIDTYVYRIGITNMQFSLATAAGLFKSVVSFVLVVTSYVCAYSRSVWQRSTQTLPRITSTTASTRPLR